MKTAQLVSSSLGSSSMIKNVLNLKRVKYRWFYCCKVLPCFSLQNTWRKILLCDCSADETLQATAGEMRGDSSGCAFSTPLLSSHSFFFLHQLCMNISSGGIGLQQQDGVEIQLHHLSHPLSSFHPSIPHTFHVVIEFG